MDRALKEMGGSDPVQGIGEIKGDREASISLSERDLFQLGLLIAEKEVFRPIQYGRRSRST